MEKKTAEKEVERNEEMEEDDVEGDVEHEGQLEIPEDREKDGKKKGKGKKSGRTSLSGRGVTLKMLLDDGVLTVEEGCMSIDYLVSITVQGRIFIFFKGGVVKLLVGCKRHH
jgi:hypothetical protein